MAEANLVSETDLILLHLTFAREELDELYPKLVASEAVDSEDPTNDAEDGLTIEGAKITKGLVDVVSVHEDFWVEGGSRGDEAEALLRYPPADGAVARHSGGPGGYGEAGGRGRARR